MTCLTLPLLLALTIPAFAQPSQPRTLAEMRDRYRPLLIFAPGVDRRMRDQLQGLTESRSDLLDRQIMLVPFPQKWAGPVDTAIMTFMNQDEPSIRRQFHVHRNEFTVILLGKDGGEKFRSHSPLTIEQLNRIVDAMPMRQSEVRAHRSH